MEIEFWRILRVLINFTITASRESYQAIKFNLREIFEVGFLTKFNFFKNGKNILKISREN